ncbi:uncharacterized protein [Bemisia tabaci]|uniref:uncharacterized protein isoform X2 n=1 Tax=Bemisia tabaci TaxID=7038 RepID=UPI003B27E35A
MTQEKRAPTVTWPSHEVLSQSEILRIPEDVEEEANSDRDPVPDPAEEDAAANAWAEIRRQLLLIGEIDILKDINRKLTARNSSESSKDDGSSSEVQPEPEPRPSCSKGTFPAPGTPNESAKRPTLLLEPEPLPST